MSNLDRWFKRMDRFFEALDGADTLFRVFEPDGGKPKTETKTFSDRYHVDKGTDAIRIYVEVPGLTHDHVDIALEGTSLTVKAEGKPHPGREHTFHRTFKVSPDVDPDRIEATVKHGILTVVLHHLPKTEATKIHVQAG